MMQEFKIHLLPALLSGSASAGDVRTYAAENMPHASPSDDPFAGAAVVVIDILRASTTITYALAAGAVEVLPCLEVDEARQKAAALRERAMPGQGISGRAILGGERDGLRIEGFDLGNSPSEYTPQSVGGKSVVFTTTNGTRALQRCSAAQAVLIGAFVNVSAVAAALAGFSRVHLLCAGTRGEITREDVLFAGCLADHLKADELPERNWNDEARLALAAWRQVCPANAAISPTDLAAAIRDSQGGRNLSAIGLERDIADVAQLDRFSIVPRYDPATHVIR